MPTFLIGLLLNLNARAVQLEKMEFPESMRVGEQNLTLNGMGLRTKHIVVLNIRAYVAALYLPTRANSADAVLAQKGPKIIELAFLRSLGKSTLTDAWTEGLKKNCAAPCGGLDKLKKFNEVMRDVREGDRLRVTFLNDRVVVEMHGRGEAKDEVLGEDFARGVLKIFIGDEPPTEALKKGLLGQ